MTRLYLDACCIVYLVEGAPAFRAAVARRVAAASADPAAELVTSRLSRLECRVKPLRDGDAALLATYDAFFSAGRLVVCELLPGVVERATELRARYGFKTPDALHVATAIDAGADVLLTGDAALARCAELRVELLSAGP